MSELVQGDAGMAGNGEMEQAEASPAQTEGTVPRWKGYRRLMESLTDEQQRALRMITAGISIRNAGETLGIHRATIYRWLKANPYFRATYNAWQLEQQECCRAALVSAAEDAVARVIRSIPVDPNLAWRVIKELGILSKLKPMSVNPSRVEMEIALEDHEEESVLLRRIEREVDKEDELATPRGQLRRLLKLKSDAELNSSRRSDLGADEEVETGPLQPAPPEGQSQA